MTIMQKETAAPVTCNASGVASVPVRKETMGFNTEQVWQYLDVSKQLSLLKYAAPFKIICKAYTAGWHSLSNKNTFLKVQFYRNTVI